MCLLRRRDCLDVSTGVTQTLNSLNTCENTWAELPSKEAHLSPMSRFLMEASHVGMCSSTLATQSPALQRAIIQHGPKPPGYKKWCLLQSALLVWTIWCGPRPHIYKDTLISAEGSVVSQASDQDQPWRGRECAGFKQPRPARWTVCSPSLYHAVI